MRPLPDDRVEGVAWTTSAVRVSVTVEPVPTLDQTLLHATGDQPLGRRQHFGVGLPSREVTDEGDGDCVSVVSHGVCPFNAEPTTLIDAAIPADQEVVANVGPSVIVHVVVLVTPHQAAAGSQVVATSARRVMDENALGLFGRHGSDTVPCTAGPPLAP